MKSIIFKKPGVFAYEEREKPHIAAGDDVLIKVLGVGICGTDLHVLMDPPLHPARPNIIFGHEYCGEVTEVGSDVTNLSPGDRVIVDPHPPCGHCRHCRSDRPEMCTTLYSQQGTPYADHGLTRGLFTDGALTSYTCVPAHSVYKIAPQTPWRIAALAEPLSCVGYAIEKLKIQAGDTVCVLGAGPMGLLFASMAKANGAVQVIVSEPHQFRREKAKKCGATKTVDPARENLKEICLSATHGLGVDHCIEAVGQLLPAALDVIRPGGKILMFGHDETAAPPIRLAEIVRKEAQIFGGFLGKYYFEKTARIIESGTLPLEEIVTHTFPLSQYRQGLDLLRAGKALKVVIYPEEY
ncbi:L-threonine 3-dehydrogenase [Lactonifactor longoviformis]|uniref:Threonine dehydrogenase n=1 Tax=Lactonifactor longoviformis DSM 17459 TaxID=1122155 RepID=A0A1M4SYJ1_9CLOT|nr:alcohol dehydrogenase catalytic domain-containing protein [Lactonifactor longoviformis]POP31213.1 L-threonine 3-dehydrogenase [Lactonifactor longoviformis]SHE37296.1 Threonine dehydrogenase [Lactonifactor longoviformis DSM 17459]